MGTEQGMGLSKKEIESHSSALFNKRINELYIMVDNAEMECVNSLMPSVQTAMAYYSSLLTLFMETSRMYESDKKLKYAIEKCVKQSMGFANYLKGISPKQAGVEQLISTCLKWRFLMQNGMHNLNYFLRMSFQEPKGIGEILKLFGDIDEIPGDIDEIPGDSKQLPAKPKQEA